MTRLGCTERVQAHQHAEHIADGIDYLKQRAHDIALDDASDPAA